MENSQTRDILELQAVPVYTRYSNPDNGFEVILYREYPSDASNSKEFCAVGTNLPQNKKAVVALKGYWEATKYGDTFKVVSHETKEISTKAGLLSYFAGLKIGFGKTKVEAIWREFAEDSWRIIREEPEKLQGISYGKRKQKITEKEVEALKAVIANSREELEAINILAQYGVSFTSSKNLVTFLKERNLPVINTIKTDVYSCNPLPFSVMEKIGADFNISANDPKRLRHASASVFFQNSISGNVCIRLNEFMKKLDFELKRYRRNAGIGWDEIKNFILESCKNEDFVYQKSYDMLYQNFRWKQESGIAKEIKRILRYGNKLTGKEEEIEFLISSFEKENGFTLSKGQKRAVVSLCTTPVGILTGGPGTGKSTITKAILFVYKKMKRNCRPMLLAPTGRAARRMSECNDGIFASTIHSAIMYCGENENQEAMTLTEEMLDGNIFIVDEVSMMDESIAYELLHRIPSGANIIFVGDPFQLPSVGAGQVLTEMIKSGVIPTSELTEIFRQKGGKANYIIENAAAIKEGKETLTFDNKTFSFCPTITPEQTEKAACQYYIKSVEKYGMDNVLLLNPYRSKSRVCADRFNLILRDALNPYEDGKPAIKSNGKIFRVGDRIMQIKNVGAVKNGDIGVIKGIKDSVASIEFNDDGNELPYDLDMMKFIDLAYCTTVHKAQGQEAKIVILVMTNENNMGLRRNLLYTAVTRAKGNVLIVGQYDALQKAIRNTQEEKRNTLLASCLNTFVA